MQHRIIIVLLGLMILMSTGCGFHLRGGDVQIPNDFNTITLESSDPYDPLTRAIRARLRLNKIQIIDSHSATASQATSKIAQTAPKKLLPSLRIGEAYESQDTVSIFPDGKTAEYQLVLTLNAQVLVDGHDLYPLTVRVFRSFFDNPLTALAKATEQDLIRQEMREQAAQQLVRQLLSIQPSDMKSNDQQHQDLSNMPKTQSASDFSWEKPQTSPLTGTQHTP